MKSQSVRQTLTPAHPGVRLVLLAALLVAGTALSGAALAATNTVDDCERLGSELKSLSVPSSELPLQDIGHMDTEESRKLAALSSGDSPLAAESLATPVLMLTPRVANIMREVFGALPADLDDGASAAADPLEDDVADAEPTEASIPAAPIVRAPQAVFPGAAETDSSQNRFIPRFQRQMYRTDI